MPQSFDKRIQVMLRVLVNMVCRLSCKVNLHLDSNHQPYTSIQSKRNQEKIRALLAYSYKIWIHFNRKVNLFRMLCPINSFMYAYQCKFIRSEDTSFILFHFFDKISECCNLINISQLIFFQFTNLRTSFFPIVIFTSGANALITAQF